MKMQHHSRKTYRRFFKHFGWTIFHLHPANISARQSVLFSLLILLTLIAGDLLGQRAMGAWGALAGMLFMICDRPGTLRERYTFLILAGLFIFAFSVVGALLTYRSLPFWIIFVLTGLVAGWVGAAVPGRALPLRFGMILLVGIATTPMVSPFVLVVVGIIWCVVAGLRPLFPAQRPAVLPPAAHPASRGWFALAYMLAAAMAILISGWVGLTRPSWIVATTLFVLQPAALASFARILQRIIGTALGVGLLYLLLVVEPNAYVLFVAAGLAAAALPWAQGSNYGLFCMVVTVLVILLFELGLGKIDVGMALERGLDVVIGCGIALGATILLSPFVVSKRARESERTLLSKTERFR